MFRNKGQHLILLFIGRMLVNSGTLVARSEQISLTSHFLEKFRVWTEIIKDFKVKSETLQPRGTHLPWHPGAPCAAEHLCALQFTHHPWKSEFLSEYPEKGKLTLDPWWWQISIFFSSPWPTNLQGSLCTREEEIEAHMALELLVVILGIKVLPRLRTPW